MKGLLTYKTFLCSLNKHIPKPYHRLGNNNAVYGALSALPKIGLSTAGKLIHVIPQHVPMHRYRSVCGLQWRQKCVTCLKSRSSCVEGPRLQHPSSGSPAFKHCPSQPSELMEANRARALLSGDLESLISRQLFVTLWAIQRHRGWVHVGSAWAVSEWVVV